MRKLVTGAVHVAGRPGRIAVELGGPLLYDGIGAQIALELIESRALSSGVLAVTYRQAR